jgi:PAS domain-containing protein
VSIPLDLESRVIMDTIPGMVALLSASGEIEVLNRQLLECFGQTQDEFRNWATNGTIHPEDVSHVIDAFSRAIPPARSCAGAC